MTEREQFQRIEELFHRLCDLPDAERKSELAALKRLDPVTYAELAALFAHSSAAGPDEGVLEDWAAHARKLGDGATEIPESIGPYRIIRLLGEGGMGRVFEAEQDEPVRRKVALKVTRTELHSEHVLARFNAERQTLALLEHPNIARIFEAGSRTTGEPWFAMEFVEGLPITQWANARHLGLRQRIELLLPVCEAVQHAHRKGIIHRDLKPSNLLVCEQNGVAVPKIIDFGIAKSIEPDAALLSATTRYGELVGTPEYMSPEQAALGSIDIDTRSDVYALGLVLYELLVGELPLSRTELRRLAFDELCRHIREDDVPRPSSRLALSGSTDRAATPSAGWTSRIRGDLDAVMLKALAKDRDRRYDSASLLADDLRRYLTDQPVLASPPSMRYRAGKFVRRHRAATLAAGLALLALVGGSTVASLGWIEARSALARAEQSQRNAEATSQFLLGLFKAADPRASPGKNPDARELLARGIARVDELQGDDKLRASVLETLGDVALALGQLDAAQKLLDEAIGLRESGIAADPKRLAFLLDRRAGLARERADFPAAKADYQRAMAVLEQAGLGQSDEFGRSLNNLGIAHRMSGDLSAATDVYAASLKLARSRGEQPSEAVASVLANLASLHHRQGDYAAASSSMGEALQQFEQLLPPAHPHFSTLRSNYAAIARSEGNLGVALKQIRLAARSDEANLPAGHIDRAYTLFNEAGILIRLGGLDAAEQRLLQAQDLLIAELGPEHPRLNIVIDSLAQIHQQQGQPEQSISELEKLDGMLQREATVTAARARIGLLRHLSLAQRDLAQNGNPAAHELALQSLQRSAELAKEQDNQSELALGYLQQALVLLDIGQAAAAQTTWQQALAIAPDCEQDACVLDRASTGVVRAQYLALTGQTESALQTLRYALDSANWSATMLDHRDLASLHADGQWLQLKADLAAKLSTAWTEGGGQ